MLFKINFDSETPIYMQIRNQIIIGIGTGELASGEKLPTVRKMAADLGINMMTVNKAYGLLKSEGFIIADRRKGASVEVAVKPPDITAYREKLTDDLKLVISEAKLRGMSILEFLALANVIWKK